MLIPCRVKPLGEIVSLLRAPLWHCKTKALNPVDSKVQTLYGSVYSEYAFLKGEFLKYFLGTKKETAKWC